MTCTSGHAEYYSVKTLYIRFFTKNQFDQRLKPFEPRARSRFPQNRVESLNVNFLLKNPVS
jgi:hypothetical protein